MSPTARDEGAAGAEQDAPTRGGFVLFLRDSRLHPMIEAFVLALLTAGQRVVVAVTPEVGKAPADGERPLSAVGEQHDAFTYVRLAGRTDLWRIPARAVRRRLDYLRYLDPEYASDISGPPPPTTWGMRAILFLPPFRWSFGRRMLVAFLARLEAGMPIPRPIRSFIGDQAPAVVGVAPLTGFGSAQVDYVRAAHLERIPSLAIVPPPRDPMGQGGIREAPTLTLVESAEQADQAARLHGLPRDRIAVVDAGATNGHGAAGIGAAEAVRRAATGEVEPPRKGRLVRPLLWLLTPLLAILLPLLRPRATAAAVTRVVRKAPARARKRLKAARRGRDSKRAAARVAAKAEKRAQAEQARAQKAARAEAKGRGKVGRRVTPGEAPFDAPPAKAPPAADPAEDQTRTESTPR